MPVYKSSVSIEATVEDTFGFISDVRNLPRFTAIASAEPVGDESVRVTAETDRGSEVTEGWFRRKPGRHPRIEWGIEGPHHYHGSAEVLREGEVCSVTLELHTDRGPAAEVDAAIDQMLLALKDAVEAS